MTTRKAKEDNRKSIDFDKQIAVEKQVTEYIQRDFSFVVFQVQEKEKRLEIESKVISTVSRCNKCYPSESWLGLLSPKTKIKESGLWLVNELYKEPINETEFNALEIFIKGGIDAITTKS